MNVLCVLGTRPEAIKMAPVIHALRADPGHFTVRLCATAQHRELLDPLLRLFDLRPDDDLGVMSADQSLPDLTAALCTGLGRVMEQHRPDCVVVQGDTTSALVSALTARYVRAEVAHVEAGLRTGRLDQPFPEEMNRALIARIAHRHFAPTERARANLRAEGVDDALVTVTGNTSIDALYWMRAQSPNLPASIDRAADGRLVFVTIHRRESFGAPLDGMCDALATLADRAPADVRFVMTVHPNPNVAGPLRRRLANRSNILLMDPLDYPQAVALLARCHFVMTDSGGLQEEAPALGKPVLVLRDVTERPEGIEAGVARLVGRDPQRIVDAAMSLLTDERAYTSMAMPANPYGDGHAAERIAGVLRGCARSARP